MSWRSSLRKLFVNLILLGLGLAIFAAGSGFSTWLYIKKVVKGEVVLTPELAGLDLSSAERRADDLGLTLVVDESQDTYSDIVGKGRVLLQTPQPGRKIKSGRRVEVTLSAGSRENPIPQLQGETLHFAQMLLGQNDTRVSRVSRVPSNGLPEGTVMKQNPPAGEDPALQSGVSLLLSDGPEVEWYLAPDFVGRHYMDAKTFLEKNHFKSPIIKYRQVQVGVGPIVLRQVPLAGNPLHRNQTVTLEVNKD